MSLVKTWYNASIPYQGNYRSPCLVSLTAVRVYSAHFNRASVVGAYAGLRMFLQVPFKSTGKPFVIEGCARLNTFPMDLLIYRTSAACTILQEIIIIDTSRRFPASTGDLGSKSTYLLFCKFDQFFCHCHSISGWGSQCCL